MAPASAASVPTDTATTKSTSKASATVVTSITGATAKKTTGSKSSAKTVTKATGAGTKAKKPARKKKTTTKPSTSGANNQIYAQSRAAQQDLAAQRNAAAIRMSDPLWYKLEDYVLPAVEKESVMSEISAQILPEQVQIVEMALDKNNLTRADITPQAFACLLEQARRYAIDILSDSQDYAFVANRVEITKADLGKSSVRYKGGIVKEELKLMLFKFDVFVLFILYSCVKPFEYFGKLEFIKFNKKLSRTNFDRNTQRPSPHNFRN